MPSEKMLKAARDGFPNRSPTTDKEAVLLQLIRANILVQNIRDKMPYDEDDVEYHDIRTILSAIGRAQDFIR